MSHMPFCVTYDILWSMPSCHICPVTHARLWRMSSCHICHSVTYALLWRMPSYDICLHVTLAYVWRLPSCHICPSLPWREERIWNLRSDHAMRSEINCLVSVRASFYVSVSLSVRLALSIFTIRHRTYSRTAECFKEYSVALLSRFHTIAPEFGTRFLQFSATLATTNLQIR